MAKILKDPGVGYKSNRNAQKLIVDGNSNVKHINRPQSVDDLYRYLINIPWRLFLAYVVCGYMAINLFFALIYYAIGIQHFKPPTNNFWKDLSHLCFFSAQTLTTVGYGVMAPKGVIAGLISSFEALMGLMSFSFITGLLYGRFSKPKSKIKFSDHLVVRDFENERALMFRVMNKRTNMMIEPSLNAIINITEKDETGAFKRNFYELALERNSIMYLPTMWTLVHKIDDKSPLYKYTNQEMAHLEVEIYILFQYHEETFNQKLYQLHSYDFSQLKIDYKFKSSYSFDKEGFTVIDHDKLNDLEKTSSILNKS